MFLNNIIRHKSDLMIASEQKPYLDVFFCHDGKISTWLQSNDWAEPTSSK